VTDEQPLTERERLRLLELEAAAAERREGETVAALLDAIWMRIRPARRRKPGRPKWTREQWFRRYEEAIEKKGSDATDKELAEAAGMSEDWFGTLVQRFGRPSPR
jgi:hypothetical protein